MELDTHGVLLVLVKVVAGWGDQTPHALLPSPAEAPISGGNVTRASFLHPQFYKKTRQLPVLLKCCEEIQPHQWKPPVEREEHRLPFWLKVQQAVLFPSSPAASLPLT